MSVAKSSCMKFQQIWSWRTFLDANHHRLHNILGSVSKLTGQFRESVFNSISCNKVMTRLQLLTFGKVVSVKPDHLENTKQSKITSSKMHKYNGKGKEENMHAAFLAATYSTV